VIVGLDVSKGDFDRNRFKNHCELTMTVSTLISGFSLAMMRNFQPADDFPNMAIYVCNVIAVHACTSAALLSTLMTLVTNGLTCEQEVAQWCEGNPKFLIVRLPDEY